MPLFRRMANDYSLRSIDVNQISLFVAIFFSYFLTGYTGLQLQSVNTFATLIWPPSGIALAVFLMYGYRIWPAIFFAAFLVNAFLGASLPIALGIALGNTLGPFVGTSLLKRYSGYSTTALRLRNTVGIVASALFVPAITATIGVGTVWLGNKVPIGEFSTTWSTWWIGDALGILIFTPFILRWFGQPFFKRTRAQQFEFPLILSSVVITSIFIFFWGSQTSFAYYFFIPLTWAALRTGPRGITLSLLLASSIAFSGTLLGHGPFVEEGLLYLQIFFGTMAGVFLIFAATVEERRRVLETLKDRVNELQNALYKISSEDEAKKEFLAVLAHELRNPLATILSSIELIRLQGSSVPNRTTLLETINERAHAMVHLLDDLLDISRISQKKLSLQKEAVEIGTFIDKLILIAQSLLAKHGHTLSITRPDTGLFVHADPARLDQIFTNLLVNAAKYTQSPGLIEIVTKQEKGWIVISVRDNGMGIPQNMLQRIFEPFFQINRNAVSSDGLGIGLPLTRRLVEMHGGAIEARSTGVNAGSEFIVRLPLLEHPKPSRSSARLSVTPTKATPKAHKGKQTFKILVVDDNKEGGEALAQLLKLRGHATAVAYTGSEALQQALRFKPEVVLLDIGLPDMDGYEVAVRLQRHNKPYFLIALTGYGQVEDKERAQHVGFAHHLTKPAGLKDIEEVLEKIPRTSADRDG